MLMNFLLQIHPAIFIGLAIGNLATFWRYVQNKAYPIYLEKQIKKGRSWVYLPIGWGPSRRKVTTLLSQILYWVSVALVALALIPFLYESLMLLFLTTSGYAAALYFISRKWIRYRFKQQENAYFNLLDSIVAEFEREGKQFSDQELHNRSSYEFQNALRSADSNSRLLKELDERSLGN